MSDADAQSGVASSSNTLTTRGWTLENILARGDRFKPIPRISALDAHLNEVLDAYDSATEPLVIDSWQSHENWPKDMFTLEYFREHVGQPTIAVRNVHTRADSTMAFDDFVQYCKGSEPFVTTGETVRLYGKDAECPSDWRAWLHSKVIPERLTPDCELNYLRQLPDHARVETLMCYLGIGDTFTPAHKDLCASSGHNLMSYTENDGSSFWFMTRGSDIQRVSAYFHRLGHELDHELHAISIEELAEAPFDVFITEQKLGDMILVPPRSCHQVVNHGGLTVKTSWSRMTLDGLGVALAHELPIYQRTCRLETYRIKLTIFHALARFSDALTPTSDRSDASRVSKLLAMFEHILQTEFPPLGRPIAILPSPDENLTCDFCGADIFQSFFSCRECTSDFEESGTWASLESGLALCAGCYSEGRQCQCPSMIAVIVRPLDVLWTTRENATKALQAYAQDHPSFEVTFSSEESLLRLGANRAVFQAGWLLNDLRLDSEQSTSNKKKGDRMCTLRGSGDNHTIEHSSALHCAGCRARRCYLHMLQTWHLHSVEAILASHDRDTSLHVAHKETFNSYKAKEPSVLHAISNGTFTDFNALITYNTKTFRICRPANPDFTRLGWYDKPRKQTLMVAEQAPSRGKANSSSIDDTLDSPSTGSESPPPSSSKRSREGDSGAGSGSSNNPPKRHCLSFSVVVPTLKSLNMDAKRYRPFDIDESSLRKPERSVSPPIRKHRRALPMRPSMVDQDSGTHNMQGERVQKKSPTSRLGQARKAPPKRMDGLIKPLPRATTSSSVVPVKADPDGAPPLSLTFQDIISKSTGNRNHLTSQAISGWQDIFNRGSSKQASAFETIMAGVEGRRKTGSGADGRVQHRVQPQPTADGNQVSRVPSGTVSGGSPKSDTLPFRAQNKPGSDVESRRSSSSTISSRTVSPASTDSDETARQRSSSVQSNSNDDVLSPKKSLAALKFTKRTLAATETASVSRDSSPGTEREPGSQSECSPLTASCDKIHSASASKSADAASTLVRRIVAKASPAPSLLPPANAVASSSKDISSLGASLPHSVAPGTIAHGYETIGRLIVTQVCEELQKQQPPIFERKKPYVKNFNNKGYNKFQRQNHFGGGNPQLGYGPQQFYGPHDFGSLQHFVQPQHFNPIQHFNPFDPTQYFDPTQQFNLPQQYFFGFDMPQMGSPPPVYPEFFQQQQQFSPPPYAFQQPPPPHFQQPPPPVSQLPQPPRSNKTGHKFNVAHSSTGEASTKRTPHGGVSTKPAPSEVMKPAPYDGAHHAGDRVGAYEESLDMFVIEQRPPGSTPSLSKDGPPPPPQYHPGNIKPNLQTKTTSSVNANGNTIAPRVIPVPKSSVHVQAAKSHVEPEIATGEWSRNVEDILAEIEADEDAY